ncbi:MAG: collagen-like protein [Paludibacteraceae bacterium]|nr:collagen-like protein [Paludibacteraceae bacterium]
MKKLFLFLAIALVGLSFESCQGPEGPQGPRGAKGEPGESGSVNMKVYSYRVKHADWRAEASNGEVTWYYYDIEDEDLNVYLNTQGVVMVYHYTEDFVQAPLPEVRYYKNDAGTEFWEEEYDFDVYEPDEANNEIGSIRIYLRANDFHFEQSPVDQVFRVVLMWP